MDPDVVTEFVEWSDKSCGDDEIGRVKAVRGKGHQCLRGMTLDDSDLGVIEINVDHCIEKMVNDCPHESE